MIQPNELRIGNYFLTILSDILQVTEIRAMVEGRSGNGYCNAHYEDIQPVPLTGEWLLKFGFEFITDWSIKGNDCVVYRKDLGWLRLETCMMSDIVCLVEKSGISTGVNIEYVHQLQNLYFALTGEELKDKTGNE